MRRRIVESPVALVEALQVEGPASRVPGPEGYSPEFQVCLPYKGVFLWHVGRDDVVADANQVLFVRGGEGFRVTRPIDGGYAELIVTMPSPVLSELLGVRECALPAHRLFRERCRPASLQLQQLAASCLHGPAGAELNGLAGDEWVVSVLRATLMAPESPAATPSTRRLVDLAREYLAANLSAPVRLADVAAAVGTSPTYLTSVFSRLERRPLHRYLVHLRLARALVELPHAEDLTALAYELGFASHSHFTAAFHRAFGCPPSVYRLRARRTPEAGQGDAGASERPYATPSRHMVRHDGRVGWGRSLGLDPFLQRAQQVDR
jgi:AraC-like DNA-binding protein